MPTPPRAIFPHLWGNALTKAEPAGRSIPGGLGFSFVGRRYSKVTWPVLVCFFAAQLVGE